MGPLGFPELLFILVLALLIFGPRRIPEIGRTLGKAMGEFRRATTDFKRTLNVEAALHDEPPRPAPTAPRAAAIEPTPPPPAEAGAEPVAGPEGPEESPAEVAPPDGTEPRD